MGDQETIAKNLKKLEAEVFETAKACGRDPKSITILPVTKYVSPERVKAVYDLGYRAFGENKVQEWKSKQSMLPADTDWHIIGRLQTNKVKAIAGKVAMIQSLDREDLAEELQRTADKLSLPQIPVLIQVNSSHETQKGGVLPEDLTEFVEKMRGYPCLQLRGLMTIGPLSGDEADIRHCFRETHDAWKMIGKSISGASWDTLSMGMTMDYKVAIEEGATLIRVGSLVFGARPSI